MSTTRRPRVLFVGAFPPPGHAVFGGMVTSCRALLASTLPTRLELDLLDSTQISNPPPGLFVRLLLAVRRCVRFVMLFEKHKPDAVLMFVAVGASILEKGSMAWYARLRGVPSMMFPRGGAVVDAANSSAVVRGWVRLAFRGAGKIVCQGEAWRGFALETLGFAPADVVVIRNWTATPELLTIGRHRRDVSPPPVRLLFVGWLERDKGIFELVEACHNLGRQRSFTLDFVGDGRAIAEARALVEKRGLADIVTFRGWLDGNAFSEALHAADVFVLPSWFEGLPNALVEAMATRLAVVVTQVGAIPDVVSDRRSGLLVPPRDVPALTRALAEIVDNSDLRAQLAEEGYRVAITQFGVEPAVERIAQEVEALIGGRRQSRAPRQVN